MEVTITARPADALTFWASAGHTDSQFENYEILPGDINGDGAVDAGDLVQRSGDSFPNTPELTRYFVGEYRQPVRADKRHRRIHRDLALEHLSGRAAGIRL